MSSVISHTSDTIVNFTRGEKCIFIHLVTTFVLILITIIIYLTHLFIVEHSGKEIFRVSRRSFANQSIRSDGFSVHQLVGVVYLKLNNPKIVCNAFLIKPNWSIAPGHSVAARSDPDMSHYLPTWRIKYIFSQSSDMDLESGVKRSMVHSKFNRDDYQNNIGLLEHNTIITPPNSIGMLKVFKNILKTTQILTLGPWCPDALSLYKELSKRIISSSGDQKAGAYLGQRISMAIQRGNIASILDLNYPINHKELDEPNNFALISWTPQESDGTFVKTTIDLSFMDMDICSNYLSPIIDHIRHYEFCTTEKQRSETLIYHGAVLATNSKIIGFFSWGDKRGNNFPLVILNITAFKDWVEDIVVI